MQEPNRLHAVLVDYVDRAVAGEAPDSEAYLAQHKDLEQQLQQYFATVDLLERLAAQDGKELRRIAHYRLLSRLGSGGNGAVYLARDEQRDRLVAVKILRAGVLTASPSEVDRFWREAELALRHPNIAAVYDAGEADGLYYLVLQYVPGPSLRQVIAHLRAERTPLAELGRIDWRDVVARLASGEPATPVPAVDRNQSYYAAVASVAADLAEALAYAHGKRTIHRDVKPDNVLLDTEGTPYLTDFGLAKITVGSQVSHSRDVVGTAEYMSPEMSAGRPTDASTDVYSLGATLYALLTLRPPYEGRSHDVRQAIGRRPPPRIARLNPHVPRDLQTIVETAMARDVRHRYPTARDFAADLRRWLTLQPIRAKPVTAVQRARAWAARNKALAAAVLLVPIVIAWGASRMWSDATWNRLVETGKAQLDRGDFTNAGLTLGTALGRRDDPAVRQMLDDALGITRLIVRSTPAGAQVALASIDDETGQLGTMKRVGATEAGTGELVLELQPGQYRVDVDGGDHGFGEYHVRAIRGLHGQTLEARLLPTVDVVADMIEIPAGTYWVGADDAPGEHGHVMDKEHHSVEMRAFYIDRCEVSNAEYARFVAATGYPAPVIWHGGSIPAGKEDLPVTWVSWGDATRYAEWAGKRLPTEDEWEVAARGPQGFRFPWGNEYDAARAHIGPPFNHQDIQYIPEPATPVPVSSPTGDASPFGVLHMAGNVREWVRDPWQPRAESVAKFRDLLPRQQRVTRGSDCLTPSSALQISASNRQPTSPDGNTMTGFRCAKSRTASHP